MKRNFKAEGLDQIIERFFLTVYEFFGIREKEELSICLAALDRQKTVAFGAEEQSLRSFYFPHSQETDRFFNLTSKYWDAFREVKMKYSIAVDDIPMEYVMGSFRILLACYGKLASPNAAVAWPDYKEIYNSIIRSGYMESDDESRKTTRTRHKTK